MFDVCKPYAEVLNKRFFDKKNLLYMYYCCDLLKNFLGIDINEGILRIPKKL